MSHLSQSYSRKLAKHTKDTTPITTHIVISTLHQCILRQKTSHMQITKDLSIIKETTMPINAIEQTGQRLQISVVQHWLSTILTKDLALKKKSQSVLLHIMSTPNTVSKAKQIIQNMTNLRVSVSIAEQEKLILGSQLITIWLQRRCSALVRKNIAKAIITKINSQWFKKKTRRDMGLYLLILKNSVKLSTRIQIMLLQKVKDTADSTSTTRD